MNQSKIIKEKLMMLIFASRGIYVLAALINLYDRQRQGKSVPFTEEELEILERLRGEMHNFFSICDLSVTHDELADAVLELRSLIDYVNYDYVQIWNNTHIPHFDTPMQHSHDMPTMILESYRNSMTEQHNAATFRHEVIEDIILSKHVLDFGCGSGFFTELFLGYGAKHVTCVDKVETLGTSLIEKMINEPEEVTALTDAMFNNINKKHRNIGKCSYDIIWISEVFHGKSLSQCQDIFLDLQKLLANQGIIYINELCRDTVRSLFFDTQMKIHTGNWGLNVIEELILWIKEDTEFNMETINDFSNYHTLYKISKDELPF